MPLVTVMSKRRLFWLHPDRFVGVLVASCSSCFPVRPAERVRLPSGPAGCGDHAGHLLSDGPAVVRRRHCPLHLPRQQPEAGVRLLGSGSAAQVPGHSGTTGDRNHDLRPHGLFCFHDLGAQGEVCQTRWQSITLSFQPGYASKCPVCLILVYPYAGPVWSLSLHGRLIVKRYSGESPLL